MTGREVTPAVCACLLLALIIWPSTGSTTSSVPSAPSGCGPAPTALENPPEMARVDGRIQSIELEIRQDGDRLCFVDRNNSDRPGIAPTIRIRPGEILRVRLFNRINDASVLRKTTPPGHATNFPGVPDMPGYFEVVPGDYHEPTGNTNLHFHGLEVKPMPCGPGIAPGDDVVTTYFVPESEPSPRGACQSAYEIAVPDDQPAGLYWYHTHFHGESEAQTLLGLSGAIVVENADDDARRQHGIADRILIVRDHLVPEPEHAAAPKPTTVDPAGQRRSFATGDRAAACRHGGFRQRRPIAAMRVRQVHQHSRGISVLGTRRTGAGNLSERQRDLDPRRRTTGRQRAPRSALLPTGKSFGVSSMPRRTRTSACTLLTSTAPASFGTFRSRLWASMACRSPTKWGDRRRK